MAWSEPLIQEADPHITKLANRSSDVGTDGPNKKIVTYGPQGNDASKKLRFSQKYIVKYFGTEVKGVLEQAMIALQEMAVLNSFNVALWC